MASDTGTAKADNGRRRSAGFRFTGSRLGRTILALNLLGLLILVGGAFAVTEIRQSLVQSRLESLTSQGELVADLIARLATQGDPEPTIEPFVAALALQEQYIPPGQRARLFDHNGELITDSYLVAASVEEAPLPPARDRPEPPPSKRKLAQEAAKLKLAREALRREVVEALQTGEPVAGVRVSETGRRVVSVSIPVQRVQAVLGVLTLEANDVDAIVAKQRWALLPFVLVALVVTLVSSVLLHLFVATPIRRLSNAADQVRLSRARAISLPDLEARNDEIGDLARSLETMTIALSDRMGAIERFAADVSHEIKNPLTSIRSAIETLDLVKDPAQRKRLIGLLMQDVRRLDRLITDISNASRLDAEISRETPRKVDLGKLLGEITAMYEQGVAPGQVHVRLTQPAEPLRVVGREGPLGQVFRNLIDNARSFSAADGEVRVFLERTRDDPDRPISVRVEDDGPGIPPENLESVFERFYTSRPQGAAFGGNSGLGLSIARQIVQAHGGEIHAENRTDAAGNRIGARFVVRLREAAA